MNHMHKPRLLTNRTVYTSESAQSTRLCPAPVSGVHYGKKRRSQLGNSKELMFWLKKKTWGNSIVYSRPILSRCSDALSVDTLHGMMCGFQPLSAGERERARELYLFTFQNLSLSFLDYVMLLTCAAHFQDQLV